jgi:tetratricopeptide (TPR) repeat protein
LWEATLETHRLTSSELDLPRYREFKIPKQQPPAALDLEDLYCILQAEPNNSMAAVDLARRLRARGHSVEAHRILSSVLKIDYRFETLFALGQIKYELDQTDDALNHLEAALLVAPETGVDLFELFKTMGNIFVRKGDFDSAEDCYYRAHRLQPESDVLQVNFGTLAVQRQDWDHACTHFRRALEFKPSNDKAWVGLGLCHRMKSDYELAWGNIEAALEYNPRNEVALGLALDWGTQDGREFRALDLIRSFLISGGWSEKMSLAFAWLSWRRGDAPVARLELERLLAVNPANTAALKLLTEIRERV